LVGAGAMAGLSITPLTFRGLFAGGGALCGAGLMTGGAAGGGGAVCAGGCGDSETETGDGLG
jgi:hypothetical protein